MFTRNSGEERIARSGTGRCAGSLLRVGRAGAPHAEWILEAIQQLKNEGGVERVGVWLEEPTGSDAVNSGPTIFRGEVWEQGVASGVPEWTRLSSDAPLPMQALGAGISCEYEVEGPKPGPILGPLLELRRVLWVPILGRQILRGLVMVGTQHKKKYLPRAQAEKTADELGLLLEFEEERRLAAARKVDLDLWPRMTHLLSDEQSAEMILGQLAESCTQGNSLDGVGAVFALIGERRCDLPIPSRLHAPEEERLVVRAQSGDTAWAHGVDRGPLETLWRRAAEGARVVGAEGGRLPLAKEISRIVAIPLRWGREVAGVLLAGLPRRKANLEVLERLEWRALLATGILEQEQRAREAEQRRVWETTLLESIEEPVVLVDREGLIAGMSRGARELALPVVADSEPRVAHRRFAELFPPQAAELVEEWVKANAGNASADREQSLEIELNAGEKVVLRRLEISRGDFAAVGMERIEARSDAGQAQEAEETLSQALEWLDEGVVVFDNFGRILARNARFLQILGLAEEAQSALHTLADLIRCAAQNAEKPEMFAADWRSLAQDSGEGTQEELSMERPIPQVIERCARPIVGSTGKKLGRVEVYREMTARRMFQSRMVQAEKLAVLGQRVTGIVHELSNPLTTILGNAQRLVLREGGGAPLAEARQILREADRAAGIVRQLLDLSRESRPEMRLVSLNELVERTVELQRELLVGSPLRLTVETEAALPRVNGDTGQLQQVLLNLLQNAQQAMEECGKGTAVNVRTAFGAPGRVELEVSDDGPGIPKTLQARIFDPFFTTKPAGMGTGLGLAIASGFVRQHGGTLSVHSPPGGGARFVVELPAAEEVRQSVSCGKESHQAAADDLPVAALQAEGFSSGPAEKPPRILVVEDEATVASLLADVLREEGMLVDVLPDGERALEAAQRVSYDLAICDLKMPGMDGQVFYGTLVRNQSPLREHILFVTGDVLAQRTQEFLERHHLPYVAKPFRVEELCFAVRRMLWGNLQAATP